MVFPQSLGLIGLREHYGYRFVANRFRHKTVF